MLIVGPAELYSLPLSALILALGSAALHAAWNLLLGRAQDVQAGGGNDVRDLGRGGAAVRGDLVASGAVGLALGRWPRACSRWST